MYQALYRKYRPQKFEDVYGQNVIMKTLKNSIMHHKIGHAYMFSGPRGTGKTTMAKIFARAVNCLNPIEGEACGKCAHCLNSFSKECIDIIEIDAASNNGVDEIRELKNKVNIVPSDLNYKIYIVDEVHMLSIGAFNALLKTLEEPPEHVIFILATTDPQKVPITIISRCQCYQFRRIDTTSIMNRLKKISELEKFDISDETLKAIALTADGGLRDAIGLLDQVTSYKDGRIEIEDFNEIYGNLMPENLEQFTNYIFSNDSKSMINAIEKYNLEGKNLIQITKQIIQFLKDKLVTFYLTNESLQYDEDLMISLTNELNKRMFDLKKSDDIKTFLEIFLLSFMHKNFSTSTATNIEVKKELPSQIPSLPIENKETSKIEISSKKDIVDEKTIEPNIQNTPVNHDEIERSLHQMYIKAHNTLATASKSELVQIKEGWSKLSDFTFDSTIGYIVCYLMDGNLRAANEKSLILSYEYESMLEKIYSSLELMTTNFNKITNLNKNIILITDKQWDELKSSFIKCKQQGIPFEEIEEETLITEEQTSLSQTSEESKVGLNPQEEKTLSLFGDIVEIN